MTRSQSLATLVKAAQWLQKTYADAYVQCRTPQDHDDLREATIAAIADLEEGLAAIQALPALPVSEELPQ